MKVVQELIAYFDRKGALSGRQLRRMLDDGHVATEPPMNVGSLCEQLGAIHYFRITGQLEGQVWGTDIYTRDSAMGAAAVHAGLVKPGESKVLRLTVVPARETYPGSSRNGVNTSDYGPFPHAWHLSAIERRSNQPLMG
jgi:hypothetical protein